VLVLVVVVVGTLAAGAAVLDPGDAVPAPPPALPQAARSRASGRSSAFLMFPGSSIASSSLLPPERVRATITGS
jgi:hypothetical protein